jgi:hypothetical protein
MKNPITTSVILILIVAAVFITVHQFNNSVNGIIVSSEDLTGNDRRCKTLTWKISIPDKDMIIHGVALEPYFVKLLLPDGKIWLLDRYKKQVTLLNPSKKTAKITCLENQPPDIYKALSNFKNMPRHSSEYIGQCQISETQAKGFRASFGPDKANVWVDTQTKLPIRIEFLEANEFGQMKPEIIWSDIAFDVELDKSIFRFDLEGYKVEELDSTWKWQNYYSIIPLEPNTTL